MSGAEYNGFHFWHHPDRVAAVLAALTAAPATDSPSRFTLQAGATLAAACTSTMDQSSIDRDSHASHSTNNQAGGVFDDDTSTFAVAARAAALDNWYRALCVPASSKSWGGVRKALPHRHLILFVEDPPDVVQRSSPRTGVRGATISVLSEVNLINTFNPKLILMKAVTGVRGATIREGGPS